MTQVRARRGSREPASTDRRNSYLALLRTPGALAFSATGFIGRMSMSMYGLGTVLLIVSLTGRYGMAGTVAAAGSIGYAVCGPIVATWADRLGQRRVLAAQAGIFTVSSAAFIGCAEARAPIWTLLLIGVAAGASMPSVGSMVRSRWSVLADGDSQMLHTAFALESVNDELIFVVGPALVTVLATQLFPAAGLGTAAVLAAGGTLLFAFQRRSEPAPKPRPPRTGRRAMPSLPAAGLITLAPAFLLLGSMFSSIDLSTVAFATDLGHKPAAGVILGTYAAGSAVGGLWYGSRHWRAPLGRRFTITTAITVAGISTFWAVPGLLALAVVGFLSGLAIAPTLMAGYAILEGQAAEHRRTEAMAWLSSTISVGVAAGSAVAGRIIDLHGARWGFGFAACCGAVAVLICVIGLSRLRTEQDRGS
ncbi:MAG TPA: MFS transporter [Streptosporangiaceae bacterium]